MEIKPIRSEKEYKAALQQLDKVFSAPEGPPEYDQAETLEILIEKYENENYKIDAPDPIEAIKYLIAEGYTSQKQLSKILGDKSKASLVLSKKRALSLNMIRRIHRELKIPLDLLVQEYQLSAT